MKIALSVALALFLFGCSDDSASSKKEEILKQVNKTTQEVKAQTVKVVEEAKKTTTAVVVKVKEETAKVVEKATEKVAPEVKKVEKKIEKKVEKKTPKPIAKAVDGKKLYMSSCLSCHGMKAEKKALTKSQVIQGWNVAKIEDALHGYKNKTYGKAMKTIMQGKTKDLSDADIKALANYISTL